MVSVNIMLITYPTERYRNVIIIIIISADILSHRQDIKYLYNVVTNLSGVRKENPMPPAESNQLLAEEFVDFFIEKIKKIQENLEQYDLFEPVANESITIRNFFLPLSKLEAQKLVMVMKTKLSELDILPTKLLKENIEKFIGLLTNIFNILLEAGVFAMEWKTALLHPLIKKVGLDVVKSNFCPVSNLSFISHLVEKAAIGQLVQHADYHRLTPQYQSAYRKNHSCETSLIRLANDALWAMEQQQATILVIMDLSAAFNMVHHDILLSVLNKDFKVLY